MLTKNGQQSGESLCSFGSRKVEDNLLSKIDDSQLSCLVSSGQQVG